VAVKIPNAREHATHAPSLDDVHVSRAVDIYVFLSYIVSYIFFFFISFFSFFLHFHTVSFMQYF